VSVDIKLVHDVRKSDEPVCLLDLVYTIQPVVKPVE